MRGRKQSIMRTSTASLPHIKKESPNEGTETWRFRGHNADCPVPHKKRIPEWGDGNLPLTVYINCIPFSNKKRIPEWGDGNPYQGGTKVVTLEIKKESPNEGTETAADAKRLITLLIIKKESPNEGTETVPSHLREHSPFPQYKKRIPEWGDGNYFGGKYLVKVNNNR